MAANAIFKRKMNIDIVQCAKRRFQMSKKDFWDNVIHDMNDYNCDGEVDVLDELQYLDDIETEGKKEKEVLSFNEWQLYCDDGTEYGLDPYDFDDEDEYLEALEIARNENMDYYDDIEDNMENEMDGDEW